jgi:hypothetical protein
MTRDEMIDILISQINEQAERELERLQFWIDNVDTEDELCELWEEKLKVKYVQKTFSDKEVYNAVYPNDNFIMDDRDIYLCINRTLSHIHQLVECTYMHCHYENPNTFANSYMTIYEKMITEKMLKDKEDA